MKRFRISALLALLHNLTVPVTVAITCGVSLYIPVSIAADIIFIDAHDPLDRRVKIAGEIVPGDYDSLANRLGLVGSGSKFIILDSNGGDLTTAIKMGRLLRREKARVFIGSPMNCNSACVFLLIGAPFRTVVGSVGIHRPYMPFDAETSIEGQRKQHKAIEKIADSYLKEMNISEALFDAMMRISPDEIKPLSTDELTRYGLNHDDPEYEDARNVTAANRIGISVQEYLARTARAHEICNRPPINYSQDDFQRCSRRIVYDGESQ